MNSDLVNSGSRECRGPGKVGRRSRWRLIVAWAILLPLALIAIPSAFHWAKGLAGDANVLAAAVVAFAVTLVFSLTLYWFTRRYVFRPRGTS